jgi:hypothetical protein
MASGNNLLVGQSLASPGKHYANAAKDDDG